MKKAHFIGICGTGMSAVAHLLQEHGWEVTGSDEGFYPPVSDFLSEYGIVCRTPHAAANIPDQVDLIVIGKHAKLVPESNEEVKAAFGRGVPVRSYPEVLHDLTEGKHSLVVAGSFGKSTCTTMIAYVLTHAGKDPSYFVGALSPSLPGNAKVGSGSAFVLEGDEYPSANWDDTSKFMYYRTRSLLLTSCEHDHVNVFPTLEDYLVPFRALLRSVPEDGLVVACLDGQNVKELLQETGRAAVTYAFSGTDRPDWYAADVRRGDSTRFTLMHRGEAVGEIETRLLGDHNVQNIVGVAALLLENRLVTPEELAAALRDFLGVRRRMELRTKEASVPVYEDFGSSRAKALAGLATIRQQFPEKRMIVLFEPHTFSFRNRAAIGWYDDLFAVADRVVVFQPPSHGAGSHDQLTLDEIVGRVAATGKDVQGAHTKEEVLAAVLPELEAGRDVVLIETSGALDGAIPELVEQVQQRFPAET